MYGGASSAAASVLRSTPTRPRTIVGALTRPFDVLLALRIDFDYSPIEALEMPVDVADSYVGKNGKVAWTRRLAADPRVTRIEGSAFLLEPTE